MHYHIVAIPLIAILQAEIRLTASFMFYGKADRPNPPYLSQSTTCTEIAI